MIRPAIRLLCAFATVAFGLLTTFAAISSRPTWPLYAILTILFGLASVFGARRRQPSQESAVENMKRFRMATMVCFTSAVGLLIFCTALADPNSAVVQAAASLGSAFWLVGFGLLLCAAYFRARVRTIDTR